MQRRSDLQRGMAVAWYLNAEHIDWSRRGARCAAAICLQQAMQVSRATGYRLAAVYAHFHGLDTLPKAPRTRQGARSPETSPEHRP